MLSFHAQHQLISACLGDAPEIALPFSSVVPSIRPRYTEDEEDEGEGEKMLYRAMQSEHWNGVIEDEMEEKGPGRRKKSKPNIPKPPKGGKIPIPPRLRWMIPKLACQLEGRPPPNLNEHITIPLEELSSFYPAFEKDSILSGYKVIQMRKCVSVLRGLTFRVTEATLPLLKDLPFVSGEKTFLKIASIVRTGTCDRLELMRADPDTSAIRSLCSVHGVGPKKAPILLEHLRALMPSYTHDLRRIGGADEWVGRLRCAVLLNDEQLQVLGVDAGHPRMAALRATIAGAPRRATLYHYDLMQRIPRAEAAEIVGCIRSAARQVCPSTVAIACGSYRRGKLSVGDVDVLITDTTLPGPNNPPSGSFLASILHAILSTGEDTGRLHCIHNSLPEIDAADRLFFKLRHTSKVSSSSTPLPSPPSPPPPPPSSSSSSSSSSTAAASAVARGDDALGSSLRGEMVRMSSSSPSSSSPSTSPSSSSLSDDGGSRDFGRGRRRKKRGGKRGRKGEIATHGSSLPMIPRVDLERGMLQWEEQFSAAATTIVHQPLSRATTPATTPSSSLTSPSASLSAAVGCGDVGDGGVGEELAARFGTHRRYHRPRPRRRPNWLVGPNALFLSPLIDDSSGHFGRVQYRSHAISSSGLSHSFMGIGRLVRPPFWLRAILYQSITQKPTPSPSPYQPFATLFQQLCDSEMVASKVSKESTSTSSRPPALSDLAWKEVFGIVDHILSFYESPARRIDIKVWDARAFPFALLYFTGSDHSNRSMRYFARRLGYSLTDTGLGMIVHRRRGSRKDQDDKTEGFSIPCASEQDIYHALGMEHRFPFERNGFDDPTLVVPKHHIEAVEKRIRNRLRRSHEAPPPLSRRTSPSIVTVRGAPDAEDKRLLRKRGRQASSYS